MHWIRRNGRWLGVGLAGLVVIVSVALFIRSYRSSGPDTPPNVAGGSGGLPSGTGPLPSPSATGSPSPSGSASKSGFFPSGGGTLPVQTFVPGQPGGFTIANLPSHKLVITVRSSQAIGRVGYIIPTSNDNPYGDVKNVGTSWSRSTTVTGRPYYAAVFVQAGPSGAGITCTIYLDGRVKDTHTTKGPYGRIICLG